jgi:predicted GH43/DUF377 family glycosyl hydrolase
MKQKIYGYPVALMVFIYIVMIGCQPKSSTQIESPGSDTSWAMLPFVKVDSVNPVLTAGDKEFICPVLKQSVKWDNKDVFNPAAVVRDGKVYLLYRAEDTIGKHAGTSRIGLAVSEDGLHFTKRNEPVLYPDNDSLKIYEWEGGIEDPRVVETEDGQYLMTYTAYDGTTARLLLATSPDLRQWTKYGTVLNGRYKDAWSKSGAVVVRQTNGRIVATRINGKYWMYFGDTDLFIASSEDLIHWTPIEENGKLKSILRPRPEQFDSRLVESGPFALLTDKGILLIYNSMNLDSGGDPAIAKGAYCAGQALFNANDPTRLDARLEKNFLAPDKPYEITGQVNQVCFVEGLVHFNDKWFLYYGTADSKIAVAVKQ